MAAYLYADRIQQRVLAIRRHRQRRPRADKYLFDPHNPLESLSEEEIFCRYRFRSETILEIVRELLQFTNAATNSRGGGFPLLLEVLITLRYLASNSFHSVVADTFPRLAKSTCWSAVQNVTSAISERGAHHVGYHLEDLGQIKLGFHAIAGTSLTV